MIKETITFTFENEAQRQAFHTTLKRRVLDKGLIQEWADAAQDGIHYHKLWQDAVDDKHAWAVREVRAERECCAAIADASAARDRAMDKSYGGSRDDSGMSLRDWAKRIITVKLHGH